MDAFWSAIRLGAVDHLGQDAAHAPDVDGSVVAFLTEEYFWWSVPPGDNSWTEIALHFLSEFLLVSLFLRDFSLVTLNDFAYLILVIESLISLMRSEHNLFGSRLHWRFE